MRNSRGNDDEQVLDRWEYQDLQRQIMDAYRALSDLEHKLQSGKKRNYRLEGDVSNAVTALDRVKMTLDMEFREYG